MQYKINGFLLSVDLDTAVKDGKLIHLTQQEQQILKLFFSSVDGFVDSQTLESEVWQNQVVTQNSLRKLISSLRLKFEAKDSFYNVRGRGYRLTFETCALNKTVIKKNKTSLYALLFFSFAAICSLLLFSLFKEIQDTELPPKVSRQTMFESNDYILDYATFNGVMFVTTRNKDSSKVYRVVNRQKTVLMSADFSGAYRGLEVHSSGHTVMHVIEDAKCKIKIYKRPIEEQIDELPCNRQNAFPSFDWIDERRFYVTFNVEQSSSIRPYIYDLDTRRLEQVSSPDFDSLNGEKFIDAFIKQFGNGIFSLRENHLDQMSLMYFEGDEQVELYNYRGKPYSIGVSEDSLFYVSNNNELLQMQFSDGVDLQSAKINTLLAHQATKIDDPLVLEGALYFSMGNNSKEVIYSTSGNFSYSLENAVHDFSYTSEVLSILGATNTGYVVEQFNKGAIVNSTYIDTDLNLRHIAYHKGNIYLGGGSGIYKVVDNRLFRISELETGELVSNGRCMLAESDGIFIFDKESNSFNKLAGQGERPFPSQRGCLYVDNLTGYIVNEKREKIAPQIMRKKLFEYQGKIAHWRSVGEHTEIIDVETGEVLITTKDRVLRKRVVSYEGDILYLGQADVNTSIVKLVVQ